MLVVFISKVATTLRSHYFHQFPTAKRKNNCLRSSFRFAIRSWHRSQIGRMIQNPKTGRLGSRASKMNVWLTPLQTCWSARCLCARQCRVGGKIVLNLMVCSSSLGRLPCQGLWPQSTPSSTVLLWCLALPDPSHKIGWDKGKSPPMVSTHSFTWFWGGGLLPESLEDPRLTAHFATRSVQSHQCKVLR